MQNKSFYQDIEYLLFNYGQVESYIEDLKEKLVEAEQGGWADIKAIQYDKLSVRKYGISKSTENAVIAKLEFIDEVNREIKSNLKFKNRIDKALKTLDKQELKVIKIRYFKNNSNEKCMEILNYKKSKFYQIKDKAIKKISVAIFGVRALKQDILEKAGIVNED